MADVYLISVDRSPEPGAVYVGGSKDKRRRQGRHLELLRSGCHPNERLQVAYNAYGEDAFSFQTIAEVKDDQLEAEERRWIVYAVEKFGAARVLNEQHNLATRRRAEPITEAQIAQARALVEAGSSKTAAIRQVFKLAGGEKFRQIAAQL